MITAESELKAGATRRVLARRQPPEFRYARDEVRDLTYKIPVDRPEFREAADLGEWCDDREVRLPPGAPGAPVLFAVLEAARAGGVPAAVKAVAEARALNPLEQYAVWRIIATCWPQGAPALAEELCRALAAEWRRLRLAVGPPDERAMRKIERQRRDQAPVTEPAKITSYETPWGTPGMLSFLRMRGLAR
jgi:hypothetical protein